MVSLRTVGVSQASDGVVRSVGSLSIRACSNRREVPVLHPYFVAWWLLGACCRVAQLIQFSSREPCPATTSCGTRDSSFTPTLSPKALSRYQHHIPVSTLRDLLALCCTKHRPPSPPKLNSGRCRRRRLQHLTGKEAGSFNRSICEKLITGLQQFGFPRCT